MLGHKGEGKRKAGGPCGVKLAGRVCRIRVPVSWKGSQASRSPSPSIAGQVASYELCDLGQTLNLLQAPRFLAYGVWGEDLMRECM